MSSAHQPLSQSDVLQKVMQQLSQLQRSHSMENQMPTPTESQTSVPSSGPSEPIQEGSVSPQFMLSLASSITATLKRIEDEIGLIKNTLTTFSESLNNMNDLLLALQHALTSLDSKMTTAKRARTGKKSQAQSSSGTKAVSPGLTKRHQRRQKTAR